MRANALGALRLLLAWVADQFDMLVRLLAVEGIKGVMGVNSRLRQRRAAR
nr:Uncharacterised protein [Raoultella sp. NCTC 9187]